MLLNPKSVDDERLAELFVHLRPNYSSEEHRQMIEWLDTDGNGTVNRSEWILSLLEVLSFGFADEILQNTPKHSKVLEQQERVRQGELAMYVILVTCRSLSRMQHSRSV